MIRVAGLLLISRQTEWYRSGNGPPSTMSPAYRDGPGLKWKERTMITDEFVKLVASMREMQRMYFRRRTPEALQSSKELERQVDQAIATLRDKSRPLFGEDG